MHGDSLLMLTTKVVSNKKPPLLSDSESGGSTSLLKINFICAYIVTIYKSLGYIDNNLSYKTEKFFLKTLQFLGLRDLSSTIILIDILIMPMLKYYDLDYIYTTNDILLSIQFIIFVVMVWIEIYSASKIKKYKNLG